MTFRLIAVIFSICMGLLSCDSGPKVIMPEGNTNGDATMGGPVNTSPSATVDMNKERKVEIQDVLHTDKYTYLDVTENDERFWIAVPRMDIEKGQQISFRGGLLKRNFFSKEYNRVFETLYLVSDVRLPSQGGSALEEAMNRMQGGNATGDKQPVEVERAEGAISLSDLFANKEKYEGKTVTVTGKCVKANPNIMGRNWIHIQDGTLEGQDLTITTMERVPVGNVVTMEGTIFLNKDFGAGYKYDIIMEGAVIK